MLGKQNNYWWSFKEEILATAVVLMVAVSGSFFVVSRLFSPMPQNETEAPGQVLGQAQETPILPTPTITIQPTTQLVPTSNPYDSEVFYGTGGMYEYEEYSLALSSPRISFDARNPQARRFMVDVTLTNKTVAQGLQPTLSATIVKDGVVIVPQTPLSIKEFALVLPGEKKSFEARLSLIEGTDVSILRYSPPSLTPIEHILQP